MTPPLVASIVVNYKGLEQTRVCVASLLAVDYASHSIAVVDNGSGPQEIAALREAFGPSIEIIESERNLGYGGGANLGLDWASRAGAAYAWVLNNDTKVDPGSVRELVDAMEREPAYGILSPQIDAPVGPESPFGVWYAGGTADLARVTTHHVLSSPPASPEVVPTGFVTGCAPFFRRAALEQTGLFWAALFLYWEDVDLSLRMREAGWGVGVVPAARIVHFVHGTIPSRLVRYYYYRNAILVARRHLGRRGAAQAFRSLLVRASRRFAASVIKRDGPLPTAEARGLAAAVAVLLRISKLDRSV